jgi:hypothetical protein
MLHIPFYPNSKDNSHCYQAVLKMVLKYYYPKETYSFDRLNAATNHRTGLWTWNSAGLMYLATRGSEVLNIENFDYAKFGHKGATYLRSIWSNDVYKVQREHCDLKTEKSFALRLSRHPKVKLLQRRATINDIRRLVTSGYLVMPTINPRVLDHMKGYSSHLVLVTNITAKYIWFHDPGLPSAPNRKVSIALFRKAFAWAGSIKAVRR